MINILQPNKNGVISQTNSVLFTMLNILGGQINSILITNPSNNDIQLNLALFSRGFNAPIIPNGQFILKAKCTLIYDTPIIIGYSGNINASASIADQLTYSIGNSVFSN
jgi:hypothetical protein